MRNPVKTRVIGVAVFVLMLVLVSPFLLFPKDDTPITPSYVFVKEQAGTSNDLTIRSNNASANPQSNQANHAEQRIALESTSQGSPSAQSQTPAASERRISLASLSSEPRNNTSQAQNTPARTAPAPQADANTGLWLRIASLTDKDNANTLVGVLKEKNFPVKQQSVTINNITYERVLVGPFADKVAADEVTKQLMKEGYSPVIQ